MKNLRSSLSGFTLTELMVVLAVAGILAMVAVPSFQSLIRTQQVKNASFDLYSSLNLARSEAIKRNANVTVTPASASDWGQGWSITTGTGTTIKSKSVLKGVKITAASSPASIVYPATGRPAATASFEIGPSAAGPTITCQQITLSLSGMPNTTNGACP